MRERSERALTARIQIPTIVRLVKKKNYGIKDAYRDTVQGAYEQRDLASKLSSMNEKLASLESAVGLSRDVLSDALRALKSQVERLLSAN